MLRSTFSTTTIASSTTMPTANTSPNSDRLLREMPSRRRMANVPISRNRYRDDRDDRRSPSLKEHEDHSDDEQDRVDDRLCNLLDRLADEDRRIINDLVFEARRKFFGQGSHRGKHFAIDRQ